MLISAPLSFILIHEGLIFIRVKFMAFNISARISKQRNNSWDNEAK